MPANIIILNGMSALLHWIQFTPPQALAVIEIDSCFVSALPVFNCFNGITMIGINVMKFLYDTLSCYLNVVM